MIDYERDEDGFIILRPKFSDLWDKVDYKAPVNFYLNRVFEYDIRQANVSVLRAFDVLPSVVLDRLANLPKIDRNVAIGNLEKEEKYKHLKIDIARGIKYAKRELFLANRLQSDEILSIKNDAVFVMGRRLKVTKFGPIEFILKNRFSMFHRIEGIEFYYDGTKDLVTAKGISDEVMETPDHQHGMLEFFRTVFKLLLKDNRVKLRKYLLTFTDQYKSRVLPHQYYRELNSDNQYRSAMVIGDYALHLTEISQDQVSQIDINYNYQRFVLPLLQQYLW